ncbi:MAG TPA: hypothetical protein VGL66_12210 [Caulobacteraceae bacterium]|jgi:hypothetical protein
MSGLEQSLTRIEMGVAAIHPRIDRVERSLGRIEKRLELANSPCGGVRE